LAQSEISVHDGDMFAAAKPNGQRLALETVELLAPVVPSKIIGLWNNFHAFSAKLNSPEPAEPLYFLKAPSSVTSPGAIINRPASYEGRTFFEGELGIVIGKTCKRISVDHADAFIFGYTCVNDLTAVDIFNRDATFEQWTRAKSYDGYGPFGPAIVSGMDPRKLIVRAIVNGAERQNYPISDMIFGPQQLVSKISHDMTLQPGDLICCGTSVGVDVMDEPVNKMTIVIDGIGELNNEFRQ
jgi:2-keto-4-pentenoate hydratase/2-oxohepta-3-ene-1,7-dioic acid hydratase in catechol pathway